MRRKGQSATEYLMTYGWAILAIVIVAATLWGSGMFEQCQSSRSGFIGSKVILTDHKVNPDGRVDVDIRNAAGASVIVVGSEGNVTIASGGSGNVVGVDSFAAQDAGTCYSGEQLQIEYYIEGGLHHTASGKISGRYE